MLYILYLKHHEYIVSFSVSINKCTDIISVNMSSICLTLILVSWLTTSSVLIFVLIAINACLVLIPHKEVFCFSYIVVEKR